MGLSDILSNPALIGMAMAGLSRDREAPMNAMRSLQMVEGINRQREEQARIEREDLRKEQTRGDNLKLLQALSQGQAANSGSLQEAIMAMQGVRGVPSTTQQFTPDQQAGTAVDYETGQSYAPQEVANPQKSQALTDFYQKYALSKGRPPVDLTQFPNADPSIALSAINHMQTNDPRMQILQMVQKEQEKGDTRDWEKEKLGLQHGNALDLEKVKQAGKKVDSPNTEVEIRYAFENETDPAKKAVLGKILQGIEKSHQARSAASRPQRERFHYSTDKHGNVWQINQDTREKINLGQIGRPGTMDFIEKVKALESGGDGSSPPPATKPDPLGLRK